MTKSTTHLSCVALAALLVGCGGGGSSAAAAPNSAPSIGVPIELSGGPTSYTHSLATTETDALTFTATDQNGEELTWQVDVSAPDVTSTGLVFSLPQPGATNFIMELTAVGEDEPAVASVSIRVQDPQGATAAINVEVVRSVAITVVEVRPSKAFRSEPQVITLEGSPFTIQGNVGAASHEVSFQGAPATDVTVVNDNTLTCLSPAQAEIGSNAVSISSQYSAAVTLASAVEMYEYPVQLLVADEELSEATRFDMASDGPNLHVVCKDGRDLIYKRSTDAGGTWTSQLLKETSPSIPLDDAKIAVDGSTVAIGFIYGGGYLDVICSEDGGGSFPKSIFITENAVEDLQICASGSYVYLAWRDTSSQNILATVSDDGGLNWNNNGYGGLTVTNTDDMDSFILGCELSDAWIVYAQAGDPAGTEPSDGLWTTYTLDGGESWAPSLQRFEGVVGDVTTCQDDGVVYAGFASNDQAFAVRSDDAGITWSVEPTLISPLGLIANAPVMQCDGEQLFAAYVLEDPCAVGVSRVLSWSSGLVEHTQINDALGQTPEVIHDPDLTQVGNYLFVTYSMAPLATFLGATPERIKFASSVDMGQTFLPATNFGDYISGNGVGQTQPRILVDGARVWMGWLDDRAGQGEVKLYQSRTDQ